MPDDRCPMDGAALTVPVVRCPQCGRCWPVPARESEGAPGRKCGATTPAPASHVTTQGFHDGVTFHPDAPYDY